MTLSPLRADTGAAPEPVLPPGATETPYRQGTWLCPAKVCSTDLDCWKHEKKRSHGSKGPGPPAPHLRQAGGCDERQDAVRQAGEDEALQSVGEQCELASSSLTQACRVVLCRPAMQPPLLNAPPSHLYLSHPVSLPAATLVAHAIQLLPIGGVGSVFSHTRHRTCLRGIDTGRCLDEDGGPSLLHLSPLPLPSPSILHPPVPFVPAAVQCRVLLAPEPKQPHLPVLADPRHLEAGKAQAAVR